MATIAQLLFYTQTGRVPIKCETKRNETKSTKTKRNETKSTKWKRNKTKPTKAKRKQRKQNEIDWYEENGRKKIKYKTTKKLKKKDNSIF